VTSEIVPSSSGRSIAAQKNEGHHAALDGTRNARRKYVLRRWATRNKAYSQHSSHEAGRSVNNELNYFVSRVGTIFDWISDTWGLKKKKKDRVIVENRRMRDPGGVSPHELERLCMVPHQRAHWIQSCHLVERPASSRPLFPSASSLPTGLIRFVDGWCRCHCGVQLYPCYPGLDTAVALGLLVARLSV
jgi:hypothetical protein